jgi:hypothetical protein
MERTLRVFESVKEAEHADAAYYASLSPQERVDLLLELNRRYRESTGETSERLERVYRVAELARR